MALNVAVCCIKFDFPDVRAYDFSGNGIRLELSPYGVRAHVARAGFRYFGQN